MRTLKKKKNSYRKFKLSCKCHQLWFPYTIQWDIQQIEYYINKTTCMALAWKILLHYIYVLLISVGTNT